VSGTTTDPSPPPSPSRPSSPPNAETGQGPPTPPATRRRTSRRVLVVLALVGIALVFLLVEGLGSSLNYFDTVDQALAHRQQLGTQTFRLEGTVVPGSIRATASGSDFDVCEGPHVVHVTNTGSPPALFRDRIPVVVVGHFTSDTSTAFVSDSILVKHSATYSAAHPRRLKAAATGTGC
jgi:cytochrome c-type biogenesis protein CcmE